MNAVKLPHQKHSAERRTRPAETPARVIISLSQSVGAPGQSLVSVGDIVKTGQKIADNSAFVFAPIHASVTGKVTAVTEVLGINGRVNKAIVIETDNRQEISEEVKPPDISTREKFLAAVRDSGSVGQGGAGFPTHVKLGFDQKKYHPDTLIINGAECEPYITADYREFIERGEDIIAGIRLIMRFLEIKAAVVGIERDKPAAIRQMRSLIEHGEDITVKVLPTGYPQGAEKVLVKQCVGRAVPEGKLPIDTGCVVLNSSTVSFLARYIKTGIPLIQKRVTIDGNIVNKPQNLFVPVGMLLSDIIKLADLRLPPDRILFGGPMMGNCVFDYETPVSKTTNAVLFFNNTPVYKESACIRCGRCVSVCSMNLSPTLLEHAYDARDAALLQKLRVNTCMNCGSCSFVCPARRNLSEKHQLAKQFVHKTLN